MTILVADIGGTNSRFALGQSGSRPIEPHHHANREHRNFASAARHYLQKQGHPQLSAIRIAVAGPVADGRARLTNHDWEFCEAALTQSFGVPVHLFNDLSALGLALPHLGPSELHSLREAPRPSPNRQALVLGLGTGVNTCGVLIEGERTHPVAAEAGHQALPLPVLEVLARAGLERGARHCCEDLFSGRGLALLHQQRCGQKRAPSSLPKAALAGDAQAAATLDLFAHLLGLWAQEIALQFLPRNGLYLAGAVARGLIEAGAAARFVSAFDNPQRLGGVLDTIPLRLITDDMAALSGCLAATP